MAEIAAQAKYAGAWGADPAVDAHALGWMQLSVAEDLVKSLSREFAEPGPSPVFGHIVLARAIIESCARAAWLADPSIGVRLRIARAESERLYSLAEVEKLPGAAPNLEARRRILDTADELGFERKHGKNQSVVSLEEWRPGQTKIVRWLFAHDEDVGELIYRWWSAVAHSTLFGVTMNMEVMADAVERNGLTSAAVVISSDQVRNVFRGVILGYLQVARFHDALFGWRSPELEDVMLRSARAVRSG
jgi:hypothetical protein